MVLRHINPQGIRRLMRDYAIGTMLFLSVPAMSFAQTPVPVDQQMPMDEVLQGVQGGPTPVEGAVEDEMFFDSNDMVPQSEMSKKGAPSKVDPKKSPASRFVLVRKNAEAGSEAANIVAADRALKLGRYESALHLYDAVYEKNKKDPNAILGRAVTLQKLERYDESIQAYEELLDLRPDNLEAHVNMLGLISQRYPSVGIRKLTELQKRYPNNSGVNSQLAFAYAQLGRYDDAMRYLGIAAGMDPRNANHIYNMAIIADRAGQKKQAVGLYEQALEIDTIHGGGRTIPRENVFERLAQLR